VFSGESDVGAPCAFDANDARGFVDGELESAYDDATRQAADWYRSRLAAEPGTSARPPDRPRHVASRAVPSLWMTP
jgi:hypothetical protein